MGIHVDLVEGALIILAKVATPGNVYVDIPVRKGHVRPLRLAQRHVEQVLGLHIVP